MLPLTVLPSPLVPPSKAPQLASRWIADSELFMMVLVCMTLLLTQTSMASKIRVPNTLFKVMLAPSPSPMVSVTAAMPYCVLPTVLLFTVVLPGAAS